MTPRTPIALAGAVLAALTASAFVALCFAGILVAVPFIAAWSLLRAVWPRGNRELELKLIEVSAERDELRRRIALFEWASESLADEKQTNN
jgi:hypothetical protein